MFVPPFLTPPFPHQSWTTDTALKKNSQIFRFSTPPDFESYNVIITEKIYFLNGSKTAPQICPRTMPRCWRTKSLRLTLPTLVGSTHWLIRSLPDVQCSLNWFSKAVSVEWFPNVACTPPTNLRAPCYFSFVTRCQSILID